MPAKVYPATMFVIAAAIRYGWQMTATVSDPAYHFTIHIPGFVLLAALLLLTGWFVVMKVWTSPDAGVYRFPPSVEIFRESMEGDIWTAGLRLESGSALESPLEGWYIAVGGSQRAIPVAVVATTGSQPPGARVMTLFLFARLPPGTGAVDLRRDGYTIRLPLGGMEIAEP
ncbi:MAG: hypothetical protein ABIQ47_07220 [Tepidiformaceae bacterium]